MLAPESTKVPEPLLVIPKLDPLMTLLTVMPAFAVMVRFAPNAMGAEMVALFEPVPALFTVIFPFKVSCPLPDIADAVVAPPLKTMLVGDPNVKVLRFRVTSEATVKLPLTVVFATSVLVPVPDMVKLLIVDGSPVVDWLPEPSNM